MDDPPLVSVIMNSLNGEKYLNEAVDSVYSQTYQNWEIVFWDNASTDLSPELARSYDSRLHYHRGAETIPLGAARNRAIERAKGEFLAFLDVDDVWLPDKLEKQIPLFTDSDVGVVFSDAHYFNGTGYRQPLYGKSIPPQGEVFSRILFNNYTCLSTVVIRSAAIKDGGPWFDPAIQQHEDSDILSRLARDWQFAYSPHVLCDYRIHAGGVTFSNLLLKHKEEEMLLHKYLHEDPDFEAQYGEVSANRVQYNHAMIQWMSGNNAIARRILRRSIGGQWKRRAVFVAMFFPYEFALRVRSLVTNRAILHYSPEEL